MSGLDPKPKWRKRKRRPRVDVKSLLHTLAASFDKSGLTDQARYLRVRDVWNDAVGPSVARRTQPFSFSRGVLKVKVTSPAWQNELTFLKRDILGHLNEALGKKTVLDIKIISGTAEIPYEQGPGPWAHSDDDPESDAAVADAAQAIDDPDIRQAFARAMGVDQRRRRYLDGKR